MDELCDIYIRRINHKEEPSSGEIKLMEWSAVVKADSTLQSIDYLSGRNPQTGDAMLIHMPHSAKWTDDKQNTLAVFLFENGEIYTRWANETTLKKAQEIADILQAQIVVDID